MKSRVHEGEKDKDLCTEFYCDMIAGSWRQMEGEPVSTATFIIGLSCTSERPFFLLRSHLRHSFALLVPILS